VSRALIRFTGPVEDNAGRPTYPEYSFYDLFYSELQLQSGAAPFIPPDAFRDKVVFVGTTAAGLHDVFTVPFAKGKMPGAQIHANVTDNLLSRRGMRPAPAWVSFALALSAAVLAGVFVMLAGVWWGVAAVLGLAAAVAAATAAAFTAGHWLEAARPLGALALSLFGATAYQYFVEGREKRLVKHVFSRFVSRDVYDQLMADPSRASLGGARRDMTVLFSDIRGFTTFTEQGRAEAVVAQLNEYFSTMVPVVLGHRGTVDKFVGDMIMALYGAPLEDPDHADHAVGTALAMIEALEGLNARWAAAGLPELDIGVGINTGDMVAGNIGSESIMSYTVIGDAVNLGSRLESLNKQYGTRIIISDRTRHRLKGRYDMRPLGTVIVKGKSEPVEIFEVRPGGAAPAGPGGPQGRSL
jgi:adenylate cyclase